MSQDNQIFSLKESDGSTNWSQAASLEIAGVFGSASPAVGQGRSLPASHQASLTHIATRTGERSGRTLCNGRYPNQRLNAQRH